MREKGAFPHGLPPSVSAPQPEETPATEPPLEPRLGELTVTDVMPSSMGLEWTVPEGQFDSFVVQYKDRDGQPRGVPVAADRREVTIPGLEPSRKYRFLLYGLQNGKRRSPVSVEAKTGETRPGPQQPSHLSSHRLIFFFLPGFPARHPLPRLPLPLSPGQRLPFVHLFRFVWKATLPAPIQGQ